jgi:hypothetical protein
VFDDNDTLKTIINKPFSHISKFLGWVEANNKFPEAKNLLYAEFPKTFVWKSQEHQWSPTKKGFIVGRVHFVPPSSGELYYMRILIIVQRGYESYLNIRTINNVIYSSFKDACYALGLIEDDKEYINAIIEASFWGSTHFLRKLFATLLSSLQLLSPELVWDKTGFI